MRRIAYAGPTPATQGGVPYMAGQLLEALVAADMDVHAFMAGRPSDAPSALQQLPRLDLHFEGSRWKHDRWYSSHALSRFASGQLARGLAQDRAIERLAESHRRHAFDAMYQFSQVEMRIPASLAELPRIIHPETHAAGELRWHRRESALAREAEPLTMRLAARGMLEVRARSQGGGLRRATTVVAPSQAFADLLVEDYGLVGSRVRVVPNIVDIRRFHLRAPPPGADAKPKKLLFISRLAVRKGVELIVGLSHRLTDLAGDVELHVIGDHGVWSDYRRLLDAADPRIANVVGPVPGREIAGRLASASVVLQPSHYEPFALTVGEALASGVPVVASDAVGASEQVDTRCCRRFPAGNLDAFEHAVRQLLAEINAGEADSLQSLARSEALRLFSPSVVGPSIAEVVESTIADAAYA